MVLNLQECVEVYTMIARNCDFDTPEGASMNCGYSSDAFNKLLKEIGVEGTLTMLGKIGERYHIVCAVGDMAFDWTFRQYEPNSPFPLIRTLGQWAVEGWHDAGFDEKFDAWRRDRAEERIA